MSNLLSPAARSLTVPLLAAAFLVWLMWPVRRDRDPLSSLFILIGFLCTNGLLSLALQNSSYLTGWELANLSLAPTVSASTLTLAPILMWRYPPHSIAQAERPDPSIYRPGRRRRALGRYH